MDVYDAIMTRRSVRSYSAAAIPEEIIKKILDASRFAPSGSNRQPTRLILIRDAERKEALVPMCAGQKFIAQAPLIVAAVGKTIPSNRGDYMGDFSVLIDTAIVLDHLTLAAREEGLGTCWIGAFNNESIKKFLHIPDTWNVVGLTPIGYPKGDAFKTTTNRIPHESFVMEEEWVEI